MLNEEEADLSHISTDNAAANDGHDYEKTFYQMLEYLSFDAKFEIEPSNLKYLTHLGGGHFGDVHLGLLRVNGSQQPVAIKTPKSIEHSKRMSLMNDEELEEEQRRQRESLRDELKVMSFLPANPNIIKLLGAITTNKDDFCVVIEYCEYGGLDIFLRDTFDNSKFINELLPQSNIEENQHVETQYLLSIADCNKQTSSSASLFLGQENHKWVGEFSRRRIDGYITTSDLLWFALQLARAMSFLTDNKVLHRDVALRNVLLKSDFTIRVADFGLSRRAGDDGFYLQMRNLSVPIQYIAPESLRSGRFSPQSESWSFGVVLWELFTFAKQVPYAETKYINHRISIEKILAFLDSGRLQIPDCAPRNVAQLMASLWHEDPLKRPNFEDCKNVLRQDLLQSNPLVCAQKELYHGLCYNADLFNHCFGAVHILLKQEEVSVKEASPIQNMFPTSDTALMRTVEDRQRRERSILQRRQRYLMGLSILLGLLCIILPSAVRLTQPEPPNCSSSPSAASHSSSSAPISFPRQKQNCSVGLPKEDKCLQCICQFHWNNCQAGNCMESENSGETEAGEVGIFYITLPFYKECGLWSKESGESDVQAWIRCSRDNNCASQCIKEYINNYSETYCEVGNKCEQMFRLLICGPIGPGEKCTCSGVEKYWQTVKTCFDN